MCCHFIFLFPFPKSTLDDYLHSTERNTLKKIAPKMVFNQEAPEMTLEVFLGAQIDSIAPEPMERTSGA